MALGRGFVLRRRVHPVSRFRHRLHRTDDPSDLQLDQQPRRPVARKVNEHV